MPMNRRVHVVKDQDLFVPHRVVRVGIATTYEKPEGLVPPDTVKDPVGRRAIARANQSVRDLPKREKVIRVGQAGESNGVVPKNKVPSMITAAVGDVYPGEHRFAYQLQQGDRILHLGDPNPMFGRWVRVLDAEITYINGKPLNAQITGETETGNRVVLHMQGNAQVRLVKNQENPYG